MRGARVAFSPQGVGAPAARLSVRKPNCHEWLERSLRCRPVVGPAIANAKNSPRISRPSRPRHAGPASQWARESQMPGFGFSCRGPTLRGIIGTLVALGLCGYLAYRVDAPRAWSGTSRDAAMRDDGWRRTADGWELRDSWDPQSSGHQPVAARIHPLTLATLQLLVSLFVLVLGTRDPEPGPRPRYRHATARPAGPVPVTSAAGSNRRSSALSPSPARDAMVDSRSRLR